jgi:hypothetical protein
VPAPSLETSCAQLVTPPWSTTDQLTGKDVWRREALCLRALMNFLGLQVNCPKKGCAGVVVVVEEAEGAGHKCGNKATRCFPSSPMLDPDNPDGNWGV